MVAIKSIIFRNLTDADFFNINKHPGTENQGGGQSYIDFPTVSVSVENWERFFENINNINQIQVAGGRPSWTLTINSLTPQNIQTNQQVKIFQRRPASVCIGSQKIHSRSSNRILAWHPENGFPSPIDDENREQCPSGLTIYLASTFDGEVWAGWFLNDETSPLPSLDETTRLLLTEMLNNADTRDGHSGFLEFQNNQLLLDTNSSVHPFHTEIGSEILSEENIPTESLEQEEEEAANTLFEDDFTSNPSGPVTSQERTIVLRQRNKRVVKKLKELYQHKCQITGEKYIFKKKNGDGYTEAHHLVHLGDNGDDSAQNLVILCPNMHRMLHYANVSPINLSLIQIHEEDGSATLDIIINEKSYTITWHPSHARLFETN